MDFLPKNRPFLIAEAGVNHNGRADLALKLVDAAADAGADAVKFQTFRADKLAAEAAPQAEYQRRAGESSQREMLKALELDQAAHKAIVEHCRRRGIRFMSTPFDEESADLLESLGMTIFKVPSGEVTNFPLLRHIARKRKPVILSTGMSTLDEVRRAVAAITGEGNRDLVILHCVSNYPCDPADANLRAMKTMEDALGFPVGFSDHTLGLEIAIAAAALGARALEKHFTLDKSLTGPDHAMSLDPGELKQLVTSVARVALALGDGVKAPRQAEINVRNVARRSVVTARALRKDALLTEADLTLKRPATGIPAEELDRVVGKRLRQDLPEDTVLRWEMVDER